jgi:hypothetical protein
LHVILPGGVFFCAGFLLPVAVGKRGSGRAASAPMLFSERGVLERDPEKWIPVFRKDHAPPKI